MSLPENEEDEDEPNFDWGNRPYWARVAAMRGDVTDFVKLLRIPDYELTLEDRDLAADLISGEYKRQRGRPEDLKLKWTRREAATFFIILTRHLKVSVKEAEARLAELYGEETRNIREWVKAAKKDLGPEEWKAWERAAPVWYQWQRAEMSKRMRRILFNE